MVFWKNYMHGRERAHHERDNNRVVRPFEWGLPFITDHVNGENPRDVLAQHSEAAMSASEDYYSLPPVSNFELANDYVTWTSAVRTPDAANNLVRARYFPADRKRNRKPKSAVLILPQWNAQPDSHVEACRIFNFLGISGLRLTLPYHEDRRPSGLERADYLVSSNIGRTLQSMRQAVLDARAAVM